MKSMFHFRNNALKRGCSYFNATVIRLVTGFALSHDIRRF